MDMDELIKVTVAENGTKVVSARELHAFLESKNHFNDWISDQTERAMMVENEDFIKTIELTEKTEGSRLVKRELINYALTLNSAKEIAMLNGNEKGKEARQYFIECERKLLQPKELSRLDLIKLAMEAELENQELRKAKEISDKLLLEQKPKVEFYDEVANTTSSFDFQETSAMLKLGYGRNILFKKLRDCKILMNDNLPYIQYINSEYFIVVESKWMNPKTQATTAVNQTRCTQKGLEWLSKNKLNFKL